MVTNDGKLWRRPPSPPAEPRAALLAPGGTKTPGGFKARRKYVNAATMRRSQRRRGSLIQRLAADKGSV